MASAELRDEDDEILQYVNGRYISATEASWRLFGFHLHDEWPSVVRLDIHTEEESDAPTMLTAYFDLNANDPTARLLCYADVPSEFVWNKLQMQWIRRKNNMTALGRMYTVSPRDQERFFCRLLLLHRKGAQSFADLRTVHAVLHETFFAAAHALGLTHHDNAWVSCLQEASQTLHPVALRCLFATILLFNNVDDPLELWNQFADRMTEDLGFNNIAGLQHVDQQLRLNGRALSTFTGFPQLPISGADNPVAEYFSEIPHETIQTELELEISRLNRQQETAFNAIVASIGHPGSYYFINGSGGCGKTFLFNTIIKHCYMNNINPIVVATSAIAAALLHGGATAHSRLKIETDSINEDSRLLLNANTRNLIRNSEILIWDEAAMAHKLAFNAVDRSFREIRGNILPFGGMTVILGGDWKQTLPVIEFSTPSHQINATIKTADWWPDFHQFDLTINQRAIDDIQYARLLEQIGTGALNQNNSDSIALPDDLFAHGNEVDDLIDFTFPELNEELYGSHAILTVSNAEAARINAQILHRCDGDNMIYYSEDTLQDATPQTEELYPTEFLNSITPSGSPPHDLILKNGVPVMLLRNLNPAVGLTNGTILIVRRLGQYTIDAEIVTGPRRFQHRIHAIPRITIYVKDRRLPGKLQRLQFPVVLAFAMTINKSQGQTLSRVGLSLKMQPFSHGQLYVALSRVRNSNSIRIISDDYKQATNVVLKAIFDL